MMLASIEYLIQRYADKTCTDEERAQLMQLLQHPDNDEDVQQYIYKLIAERDVRYAMPHDPAEAVLQTILQTGKSPVITIYDTGRKIFSVWQRVAVAASIALLLSVGGWLWFNRAPSADIVKTEKKPSNAIDILPGGNKALLTLDDGSTIVLDSTSNGIVAQQGGATVLKSGDGQLAYNVLPQESKKVLHNTLSIPRGGQYQLLLPDGTKVWLNSETTMRYPTSFNGKERSIELSGEAYFEVVKNVSMPFKVNVKGKAAVEVLGTHFNINSYAGEPAINTTLLEGSVRVTGLEILDRLLITPGQQAQLKPNGQIYLNKSANIDQVMAWKDGNFQFEDGDIHSVMRQLARWYDMDVEYSGNVSKHFGGTISRNVNLSQVLNMLQQTGEVRFRMDGKKIIVLP